MSGRDSKKKNISGYASNLVQPVTRNGGITDSYRDSHSTGQKECALSDRDNLKLAILSYE
jgi:hypothetical protein